MGSGAGLNGARYAVGKRTPNSKEKGAEFYGFRHAVCEGASHAGSGAGLDGARHAVCEGSSLRGREAAPTGHGAGLRARYALFSGLPSVGCPSAFCAAI